MARIGFALILIITGATLLSKSMGWLPVDLSSWYLDLAERYWPAVLILFGIKMMIGDRQRWAGEAIRWFIWLLITFWIICIIWGHQKVVI